MDEKINIDDKVAEIFGSEEYKKLNGSQKPIVTRLLAIAKTTQALYLVGKNAEIFKALDQVYSYERQMKNQPILDDWVGKIYGKGFFESYAHHRKITETIDRR